MTDKAEQYRAVRDQSGSLRQVSRGADGNKTTSPVPSPGSWNVDRGRSRVRRLSNSFSADSLKRRGYHTVQSSFGKEFHVEKRWKLVREMGSGAYGVVISALDELSGETVAIKLVTRVFDKVQLAKRALREITLLRHFASHENITGLIDVDAISPDFNEIYIFMEPMEADLHQIIKSGQHLTNEHVQYFLYQVLRGMKYIHSASVIHRDLKPGNLLVNADCELKICDFGLSRGFNSKPDENATHLTEYVATRWYRAPEIMLAFRRYTTAIDVWSIGCIFAELLTGKPLFKGKDYVDQLNKILNVLGTPEDMVMRKIGSEKAQAYVRSLPVKKSVPLTKILPHADHQALDLLKKMLAFDPDDRITVPKALEHPWLSAYHDVADEPECPNIFEKWQFIEELKTIDEFREALWNEIRDYRKEVRGVNDLSGMPIGRVSLGSEEGSRRPSAPPESVTIAEEPVQDVSLVKTVTEGLSLVDDKAILASVREEAHAVTTPPSVDHRRSQTVSANDPVVTYSRRSSIMQPTRAGSYSAPFPSQHIVSYSESAAGQTRSSVAFPSRGEAYVVPARSRTQSAVAGSEAPRRLLRTLSTVSIHESAEGLAGGLADLAPIGKYIVEQGTTGADAPASEMPRDFGIDEEVEEEDLGDEKIPKRELKDGMFFLSEQLATSQSTTSHRNNGHLQSATGPRESPD